MTSGTAADIQLLESHTSVVRTRGRPIVERSKPLCYQGTQAQLAAIQPSLRLHQRKLCARRFCRWHRQAPAAHWAQPSSLRSTSRGRGDERLGLHARRGQATHPQDVPVDGPCGIRDLTTAPGRCLRPDALRLPQRMGQEGQGQEGQVSHLSERRGQERGQEGQVSHLSERRET